MVQIPLRWLPPSFLFPTTAVGVPATVLAIPLLWATCGFGTKTSSVLQSGAVETEAASFPELLCR